MTAFDVDLDELRRAVAALAICQRDLIALAADIDGAEFRLQSGWSGAASDARAASHESWRSACADMVTALVALRAIAESADGHYSAAASANLELWRQIAP